MATTTSGGHREYQELANRGYRWFQSGVQGPNVAAVAPIKNYAFNVQEQPGHPLPQLFAGRTPYKVVVPGVSHDYTFNTQEQPFHPSSFTQPGRYTNTAAPPQITDRILLRQEQPDHPRPTVNSGVFPKNVALTTSSWVLITPQWQPYHPKLHVSYWKTIATIEVNNGDKLVLRQEQPYQALWPPPPMMPGWPTEGETAFGYIIGIG